MRKIISLLLFLLISTFSYSQMSFGAQAGFSLADTKSGHSITPDANVKPSYYFGGIAEYKFSKYAIIFEPIYTDAGSQGESDLRSNPEDAPELYKSVQHIQTVNFYLSGKYYVYDKFGVLLGGYVGAILSAENKLKDSGNLPSSLDNTDYLSKIDYGISIGADYNIYKGFAVNIKYSFGLKDLENFPSIQSGDFDENVDPTADISIYTRLLFFGASYKF